MPAKNPAENVLLTADTVLIMFCLNKTLKLTSTESHFYTNVVLYISPYLFVICTTDTNKMFKAILTRMQTVLSQTSSLWICLV